MEQLVSRLKLAKENALARRAKDEEAKRMARKRKRHESYVRKKQTASLELSKQEQTGEPQRKTTGIQDESQNEVRIKKKQQPVKKKSVKQNIEPSEIHTEKLQSKSKSQSLVELDIHVQVNTQSETAPETPSSTRLTGKRKQSTKGKRAKAKVACRKKVMHNAQSTNVNVSQTKTKLRRKQWKVYSMQYRAKIKSDPQAAMKQQQKEHERYLRRRSCKKIKLIDEKSERDKRKTRRQWQINTRNARNRRNAHSDEMDVENGPENTTEQSGFEADIFTKEHSYSSSSNQSRQKAGRKKVRRDRAAAYLRLKKLETELKEAQRRANRYKKRLQRIKGGVSNLSPSPATKVRKFLKGRVVPLDVRKKLEYSECVDKQLKLNAKEARTHTQKQQYARSVSGFIMQKYRLLAKAKAKHGISWWQSKHAIMGKNIRRSRRTAVSTVQVKQVRSFLADDTNSRMCAGKRECVTQHGEKQQKRFLNDSLLNLHKKYVMEYNDKMSYATFCRLRPFWVLEPQVKDRETCLCVRHENMAFLVSKLNVLGVIEPKTPQALCNALVCSTSCKACMYGECDSCRHHVIPQKVLDCGNKSFYYRWKTTNEKRIRAKDGEPIVVKITAKQKVEATCDEMLKGLQKELPNFKEHQYRVNHQQTAMTKMKESLRSSEVLMIIDFSENYMCKYGAETQSVHFGASRQQISLHTGVFYYRPLGDEGLDAENIALKSFCTLSQSMRHDPSAIWAHLKPVFSLIQETCPYVDTLHIWSDGPTTQYRNRRNFGIFTQLHTFGNFKSATWNFSESGHGKDAADGVGGSLKRKADKLIARGEDITNADMLLSALQTADSATQLYMVQEDDIKTIDLQYDTSAVKTIKGTMLLHQVTWSKEKPEFLSLRSVSCLSCTLGSICQHYNAGGIISLKVNYENCSPSSAEPVPATSTSQTVTEAMSAELLLPTTSQTSTSQTIIKCTTASSAEPVPATSAGRTVTEAMPAELLSPTTCILSYNNLLLTISSTLSIFYFIFAYVRNILDCFPDLADFTGVSTDVDCVQLYDYVAVIYDDKWFPGRSSFLGVLLIILSVLVMNCNVSELLQYKLNLT